MGGVGDALDARMSQIFEIMNEAPIHEPRNFLDIGMGQGQLLKWLAGKEKSCTGIGLEIETYGAEMAELKKQGINIAEGNAEKLPFPDKSFDGVIMSHTLEHCLNTEVVLKEAKRVLRDTGWFFVFVPPYDPKICSGHVNTGWNVGQLMYVLLLNGFDVKNGHFIRYGYNVAGFVQKEKRELPPLRFDRGDISILAQQGFWPASVESGKKDNDSFYGDILSINWDPKSKLLKKITQKFGGSKLKNSLFFLPEKVILKCLPVKIRFKLSRFFALLSKTAKRGIADESNNKINPKVLKG